MNSPAGWGFVSAHGALGVWVLGMIVGIGQSPATEEANNPLYNVELWPMMQHDNHQYGDYDE
jgi:hypothetical protein